LLLDTEVWLWLLSEPERVRAKSLYALEDPQNDRFVSLVSYWEISIKNGLGKLPLPLPLEEFLPARLEAVSGYLLGISPAHVIAVAALPHIHRDLSTACSSRKRKPRVSRW
jgi:PIN domain nuclease of toxin-antitoxin system